MKRLIILCHRYLGIPMSLVFVIWFVSGIVMMYTGDMPSLGEADRLHGRGPLELGTIGISPAEALERAEIDGAVGELRLVSLLGRPAYRLSRAFGPPVTVFADNGEVFDIAGTDEAKAGAARFVGQPLDKVRFVETVEEPDQWTMTEAAHLPLERFDVDDGSGTRIYFSRLSGQVELVTTRRSRQLAWAGAIPHWFYFTPLRMNQPVWYWTVVWIAAAGCVLAVLGLVLAFTQFRRSRPFRLSSSIRYRGWMRWHYYSGALFGVFALTWVFSGLMSMEPFAWTQTSGMRLPRDGLLGGALDLERYDLTDPVFADRLNRLTPLEIEMLRIESHPYYAVTTSPADHESGLERRIVDAETLQDHDGFAADSILAMLANTVTDASIAEHEVLARYDAYYYAQDAAAPLPVLRVKFDDPSATWYYFDLATGGAVAANHRSSRIERWLFNGLHSLDFGFWYGRRPLWDLGMIVLSLGALATSGIGLYLGIRRMLGLSGLKAPR
ncbi:MAG: PepSY domain-containing protein [Gammaproteobacteria bacterium]